MITLSTIPVTFNQEAHTYTLDTTGQALSGVTSTLMRRLFPDKYKGIPKAVLARAAERGTNIHEDVELSEELGFEPTTDEGRNYLRLKKDNCLRFLESEYTVSDMEHYASQIDLIFEAGESSVHLADIKTTSVLDVAAVSWQLSIYAYLFALNNPGIAVERLYAIWLRGERAELVPVPRHTDDEVLRLIEADLQDLPFVAESDVPAFITEREDLMLCLERDIRSMKERLDQMKQDIMDAMTEQGSTSIDTGRVLYTITKGAERSTFDSRAFRKEHEDLYQQFMKKSTTAPAMKITIR